MGHELTIIVEMIKLISVRYLHFVNYDEERFMNQILFSISKTFYIVSKQL